MSAIPTTRNWLDDEVARHELPQGCDLFAAITPNR